MGKWMHGQMDAWVDGWMGKWMDGQVGYWVDGWMGKWIDGYMGGWVDVCMYWIRWKDMYVNIYVGQMGR